MDLNADLGEGFGVWRLGDDLALLDIITSANVACGFHAGDPPTMRRVTAEATARGVAVGAQVSYRDLAGFGRRRIDYEYEPLRDEVLYQIAALDGICRVAGGRVRYVKPHGALYHAASVDEEQAAALVAAMRAYDPALPVLCLPGSMLAATAAAAGLRTVTEGFADRGYRDDGTLVPRGHPGAVLTWEQAAPQVVRLAGTVESICVHSDTPGAVTLARRVRHHLQRDGISLRPFV
ncbi:MAG: 5-oxoprolinase subunit PxpA [Micromonosporaceae bacterium]|nr:5-oxoprolinase subunit PxpA [Micromonosporaceae bacterium]